MGTIFGDMIRRSYKDEVRKEDEVIMKNFIESRSNPENYYIEDGKVCCEGNVIIRSTDLIDGHFPVKFGKVDGSFYCTYCITLTSLEGTPEKVGRDFDCNHCDSLTSLEGAPKEVGRDFSCSNCNSLTSLEGTPEKVGRDFDCNHCDLLTSLEGAPEKVGGDFYCSDCLRLESLEGAPEKVDGDFNCRNCKVNFTKSDLPKDTIIKGDFKC